MKYKRVHSRTEVRRNRYSTSKVTSFVNNLTKQFAVADLKTISYHIFKISYSLIKLNFVASVVLISDTVDKLMQYFNLQFMRYVFVKASQVNPKYYFVHFANLKLLILDQLDKIFIYKIALFIIDVFIHRWQLYKFLQ